MSYILPRLDTKKAVDSAIKSTEDKVLVLRFGREADAVCMQLDEIIASPGTNQSCWQHCQLQVDTINYCASVRLYRLDLAKNQVAVSKMAEIFIVDVDAVPVYTSYFDISLIPATIFFFNGQHMKVDWGTPDHTKFIGSFKRSQDFIDVVEVIYRGAMKGKLMVTSPLDPQDVPKYSLLYKDI